MPRPWTRKEAIFKGSSLGLQRRTALRALCALDEEIVAPDGIVASLAWPHRLHFPGD